MCPPVAAAAVAVFKLMAACPTQGQHVQLFGEIAGHESGLRGFPFSWDFPREIKIHFPPAGEKSFLTGNGKHLECFCRWKMEGNWILTYVEFRKIEIGSLSQKLCEKKCEKKPLFLKIHNFYTDGPIIIFFTILKSLESQLWDRFSFPSWISREMHYRSRFPHEVEK